MGHDLTPSTASAMRILLAPALLIAACGSALAAEPTPFRAALAAAGGCGHHRALAEERLGRLDAATASAVPQGEADLFGKPAGLWTEDEVRDALAAFAACESGPRPGHAASGRERLARDLRGLETALRRAIVVGHARAPEGAEDRPPHGSGRGAAPTRAAASSGPGRLRQGPAFIPAARAGGAAPEGRAPVEGAPDAAPAEARLEAAASAAAAVPEEAGPAIRTAIAREQGHAASEPSRPVPAAAHRPPTERTQCPVSLGTFEILQAEMRLAEVEALLGCRGSIEGTATIPGLGAFETYLWSDRGGSFTVTLVFQNKRLKSKAQRGLGAEAGRGS